MKIKYIKWQDAGSIEGWVKIKNLDSNLSIIDSIGFVSKETDEAIWLAGTINFDDEHDDSCACVIVIPKKMIVYEKEIIFDR